MSAPKLGWVRTEGWMTFVYNGQPIPIKKGTPKYETAIRLSKKKDKKELIAFLFPAKKVSSYSKGKFAPTENAIVETETNQEIPMAIAKKLMEFSNNSYPFRAINKFWENLKKNPNKDSREQLFMFLEHNHYPITADGHFLAYKYVTEKEKGKLVDSHTGRFNNNVGSVVVMDRKKCDTNRNQTCSSGLHVAAYEYAHDCGSGQVIVVVKVNPKDVVAVPCDYNNQKMRVCRYEVVAKGKDRVKNSYVKAKFLTGGSRHVKPTIVTFDQAKLSGMTAKEIIDYVKDQTGLEITLSLKNKKAILKRAVKLLSEHGLKVGVETIPLSSLTAPQIIDVVKKKLGHIINLSLKNKKGIMKRAKEILEAKNFTVK